ncbi:MAG TPA: DUF397 domain-containing protein [Pseudonocardiaceae bacterium]|jgi:hypothetical protein|nr:DUF397 domain-containing protein [Pseudonocardiaceae bacterium]
MIDRTDTVDLSDAAWRKSSRSGGSTNTNCVEIARVGPMTAVRDSKNIAGPVLAFPSPTWADFLSRAS